MIDILTILCQKQKKKKITTKNKLLHFIMNIYINL